VYTMISSAVKASLPRTPVAFLFPGQGAQKVGMVKELAHKLPKVKELYKVAEKILGYNLLDICIKGPVEKLNSTSVCQPAMYMSSFAALENMKVTSPDLLAKCNVAAGLSLGEYTALAFAGAMSWEDGLRVVKGRAEAMQMASEDPKTGMASIVGVNDGTLESMIKQVIQKTHGKLKVTLYLSPIIWARTIAQYLEILNL